MMPSFICEVCTALCKGVYTAELTVGQRVTGDMSPNSDGSWIIMTSRGVAGQEVQGSGLPQPDQRRPAGLAQIRWCARGGWLVTWVPAVPGVSNVYVIGNTLHAFCVIVSQSTLFCFKMHHTNRKYEPIDVHYTCGKQLVCTLIYPTFCYGSFAPHNPTGAPLLDPAEGLPFLRLPETWTPLVTKNQLH